MGSRFIRKVRTASGAVAVQIMDQAGHTTTSVEHFGSANSDAELALLPRTAEQRLHPGQLSFDLGDVEQEPASLVEVADWTNNSELPAIAADRGRPRSGARHRESCCIPGRRTVGNPHRSIRSAWIRSPW